MVELLTNGDFSLSTGQGAGSVAGPGWTTGYTACGPNLFNTPCGAQRWAFFTTNAGQVTGNYPGSTLIAALGGRSMAVNVAPNLAVPIIQWANVPLVTGQKYRFRCQAAKMNDPFSVALRIDGVIVQALADPVAADVWTTTDVVFTWTGSTGNHTVSINSNSGVAGGNDHAFDGFSLDTVEGIPCEVCALDLVGFRLGNPAEPVFAFRVSGAVVWYDRNGNTVPSSDVVLS